MEKKNYKILLSLIFWLLITYHFLGSEAQAKAHFSKLGEKSLEEKISEFWMGVYMEGIKVGYSHSQEFSLSKQGQRYKKSFDESWMRVSRLGGNPVEIKTIQDTLYDVNNKPLEIMIRTKMSEKETVIKAEVNPDKVLFKIGDKVVKELAYEERFYLGVPLEEIIKSNVTFENPQEIKRVTFKLSGISADKIKNFPYDDGSQKILYES